MTTLQEQLILLGDIIWMLYGITLLLIYQVSKITKLSQSIMITLMIVVAYNLIMIGYGKSLSWWDALNEEPSKLINFCWYIGYTVLNLLAMLTLYYVHKQENVCIGRFGQYVSSAFCAAALLQLAQYGEIALFQSVDKIGDIYTYGIPAINIATAIIALALAISSHWLVCYKQGGLKVLAKWSI